MKIITMLLPMSLIAILSTGCTNSGSDNGDGNDTTQSPTPVNLPIQFFADGYFTQGYSENWGQVDFYDSLIGRQNDVGTVSVTTEITTIFNGQSAVPVNLTWSYTDTSTNVAYSISETFYYSTNPIDRRLTGFTDNVSGVDYFFSSTATIPLFSTVGNSGTIGVYSGSDGITTVAATWELRDGFNGNAYLDINLAYYNNVGDLIKRRKYSSLIDETGYSTFFQLEVTSFGHTTVLFTSDRQS